MFLFYKSMTCALYLRKRIIFTLIFQIVAVNHCKSIKSIELQVKINKSYKLVTRCTSEDKRVWRYCNNNDYKIKDRWNIIPSQTKRRIVSTEVVLVLTVIDTTLI